MAPEVMDVLLVEDDEALANGILAALRRKELSVDYAADTAEARRMLARKEFRVILVDLVLPDGSGFDVVASIAEQEGGRPQVVVITGASPTALGGLDRSIVQTVLFKPLDLERLAAYVHVLSVRTGAPV